MKNTQINNNPTAFFLQQSTNATSEHKEKINEFVKKLLNLKSCVLCKIDFNFTDRIPRILIHCGHTFCSACLKNFHKNRRIRCPMCLKLVKNIDTLERLPVNHTIFSKMAEECKEDYKKEFTGTTRVDPKSSRQGVALNEHREQEQFFDAQKKFMGTGADALGAKKQQDQGQYPPVQFDINNYLGNPHSKQEPFGAEAQGDYVGGDGVGEGDLEYCNIHTDRVKHFYCLAHKTICCRVCKEILHAKEDCVVVDLYETEDIQAILNDGIDQGPESKNLFDDLGADDDLEDDNDDRDPSTNSA